MNLQFIYFRDMSLKTEQISSANGRIRFKGNNEKSYILIHTNHILYSTPIIAQLRFVPHEYTNKIFFFLYIYE
jgi:hypothetical protein